MNKIHFTIPTKNDLWYRIKLLSDPDTMSYNIGYGENGTGCYHRTQEQAEEWYDKKVNVPGRFYAYITRSEDNTFVGDVAIHFKKDYNVYIVGILIQDSEKGKGYAEPALRMLVEHAFYEMGLDKVADNFPKDRIAAERLFAKLGFVRQDDELVVLTKTDYEALRLNI